MNAQPQLEPEELEQIKQLIRWQKESEQCSIPVGTQPLETHDGFVIVVPRPEPKD